ncbi:MAG: hypothetical protein ACRCYN_13060, partial [Plesiomonas sp.]
MHRIDTATAQIDKFGSGKNGFTAGNPQTGTPATEIDAAILDSIQEEICGVIEGAKIALAKNDRGQLLKALNFFLDKKLSKDQSGADIPDKELFLQNLQIKQLVIDIIDIAVPVGIPFPWPLAELPPSKYGITFGKCNGAVFS